MKLTTKLLFTSALATSALAQPVTESTLDEHAVFKIPVSQTRITTVSFPGTISAIDAFGMTLDGSTPGVFQLAFQPSNSFFSLRALSNGAAANLNVVFKRKVYVLEATESKDPTFSAIFREPLQPLPGAAAPGAPEGPRLSLSQLLSLIQKVKWYQILQQRYPDVLAGATRVQLNQTNEFDTFRVCARTVTRFETEDALVFELELQSKTGRDIRYDPKSLAVRVGSNLYHAAISDADGEISARYNNYLTLAIAGRADGQRNDLSPTNSFVVLLAPAPSRSL